MEPDRNVLGSALPDLPGDNRPRFDTVPVRGVEFGYVDAEGERNPDFFKSVFLCGDGLAAEEAANRQREEDEWQAKVVVDNVRFTPHFTSNHPTQLHKLKGMLDGKVKHKGLRIVHKARLPSGKKTAPPVAAPASIFTGQEYENPVDFTTTLKVCVLCCAVRCGAVRCCAVLCCATLCYAVLCHAMLCCAALCGVCSVSMRMLWPPSFGSCWLPYCCVAGMVLVKLQTYIFRLLLLLPSLVPH